MAAAAAAMSLEVAAKLWATSIVIALVTFVLALLQMVWRDDPFDRVASRVFVGAGVYALANIVGGAAVAALFALWSVSWAA